MQAEFRAVELVRIIADPNQPRKFFHEEALQELTDSVREKGVVQPIVIRPTSDGQYMVVVGERRYRASLAVMEELSDRNTIPAVIRDLNDQETLELQIIENLQREKVHPMEEAVAFKSLNATLSTSEIALKVGKSESYVLKRMKLTELVEVAQHLFYAQKLEYSEALRLARYESQAQIEILQSAAGAKNLEDVLTDSGLPRLQLGYRLDNKSERLDNAKFDLSDETLYPEAGACSGCEFNTSTGKLIFGDERPKCLRPSCFELKTLKLREARIEQAKSNPDLVLISTSLWSESEKAAASEAKKNGINLLDEKQFNTVWDTPDEPDTFEQRLNGWIDLEAVGEETAREMYAKYVKQCKDEEAEFLAKVEASKGKIKKAFIVAGSSAGEEIWIELKDSVPMDETGSLDEIGIQIAALKDKEKRNKELDAEKIWAQVRELAVPNGKPGMVYQDGNLKPFERTAIGYAMLQEIGYDRPERFQGAKFVEGFFLSEEDLNEISRYYIRYKLFGNYGSHQSDTGHRLGYMVLKLYLDHLIRPIEEKQKEKAEIRIFRMNEKIAELKKPKVEKKPGKQTDLLDAIAESKSENPEPVQDSIPAQDPEPIKSKVGSKKAGKELQLVGDETEAVGRNHIVRIKNTVK